jgi:heme/copper-type cytochrome/quinol oxidase subunit 2
VGVTRTEYLLICSIFSSFCDDDDDDDDGDDNNNDIIMMTNIIAAVMIGISGVALSFMVKIRNH